MLLSTIMNRLRRVAERRGMRFAECRQFLLR